jgi:putative hydrolase
MKALAITDHGPCLQGRDCSVVFDRLHDPVEGIRFLKGMECNLGSSQGSIDVPRDVLPWLDIVLLGIHPNTERGLAVSTYTNMLISAIERNPHIDIITHPNDQNYKVDFRALAQAAREHGVAIELNNSKTMLKRVPDKITLELIEACAEAGCSMAVCSDAHAINELGRNEDVLPLLKQAGFPRELVINDIAERAFAFIESRRGRKTAAL